MIAPFSEIVGRARTAGRAVGAFTIYGLETAVGVIAAAEKRQADVIILISAETFRSRLGPALLAGARALCEQASVRTCLQLDHAGQLELVEAGFAAGFGSVMVDGSRLSLDQNAELVTSATRIARAHGGGVEAELGRVEGDEDVSRGADVGLLTDPAEAERFMTVTGAACLAVSIGNIHGSYRTPARLDLDRLERIRCRAPQPLSLHGASGIPVATVRNAIRAGISKVNVNTELRQAYFGVLKDQMVEVEQGAQLLRLGQLISDRVEATVGEKLDVFGSTG